MKVGFKISLGGYNMLSIESGEHLNFEGCMEELYKALAGLTNARVKAFVTSFYGQQVEVSEGHE